MASLCTNKKNVTQPITVEINALWRAMELYSELELIGVVFKSDAQSVIIAINNEEAN